MPVKAELLDGSGSGVTAKVTPVGELVVGKISYSTPFNSLLVLPNTRYTVIPGVAQKSFVMTDILIATDRNFATTTTPESVQIYQAPAHDLTINSGYLLNLDMLRNDRVIVTGLNIKLNNTHSLVAIAADTSVSITAAGYYVNA